MRLAIDNQLKARSHGLIQTWVNTLKHSKQVIKPLKLSLRLLSNIRTIENLFADLIFISSSLTGRR